MPPFVKSFACRLLGHFHFGFQHVVHDLEVRLRIGWRQLIQTSPVPRCYRLNFGLVLLGHSSSCIHKAAFAVELLSIGILALAEKGPVRAFAGRGFHTFLNADDPEVLVVVAVSARKGPFNRESLVLGTYCRFQSGIVTIEVPEIHLWGNPLLQIKS